MHAVESVIISFLLSSSLQAFLFGSPVWASTNAFCPAVCFALPSALPLESA